MRDATWHRDPARLLPGTPLDLAGVHARANVAGRAAERARIARAQRIARAGPSKAARKPSPAVSSSSPGEPASSRRTASWCSASSAAHARVAELLDALGGADEVGDEDRVSTRSRQAGRTPGEELLDLVEDLVGVDGGRGRPRELHEARARDRAREVARPPRRGVEVAGAVEHERRALARSGAARARRLRVHEDQVAGARWAEPARPRASEPGAQRGVGVRAPSSRGRRSRPTSLELRPPIARARASAPTGSPRRVARFAYVP
jgi:hypothetical protein